MSQHFARHGLLAHLMALVVLAAATRCVAARQDDHGGKDPPFTLGFLTGSAFDTSTRVAADLVAMLRSGQEIGPNGEVAFQVRLVPGQGGTSSIDQLLTTRGVDLAVVPDIVLNRADHGAAAAVMHRTLVYVARLFPEDVLLVARSSGIKTIKDLAGKRVSTGPAGGDVAAEAGAIFADLGVNVIEDHGDPGEALGRLKSGDIDAIVAIGPRPVSFPASTKDLVEKQNGSLHLVSIPFEASGAIAAYPATLDHEAYPALVPDGATVDTLAVSSTLMAVSHPTSTTRYQEVQGVVRTFLDRFASDFQDGKTGLPWRQANLAATLPGWKRFAPVQVWLRRNDGRPPSTGSSPRESASTMTERH